MDDNEKYRLWWRVAEKHFGKPTYESSTTIVGQSAFGRMREFLGVDRTTHYRKLWTPELEQKLLMLDGPHGKALFKAMEAVKCQTVSSRAGTTHDLKSL